MDSTAEKLNKFYIGMLIIEALRILKGEKINPFPDQLIEIQRKYMLDCL